MIVDSSAIVAILFGEPDGPRYSLAMTREANPRMSVATWLETCVVVERRGDPVASRRLDEIVDTADVELVPVSVAQARIARRAYRDFGRGSGSQARLNFGDCFAYALAAETREPLLFKGNDFTHTDLTPAEVPTA